MSAKVDRSEWAKVCKRVADMLGRKRVAGNEPSVDDALNLCYELGIPFSISTGAMHVGGAFYTHGLVSPKKLAFIIMHCVAVNVEKKMYTSVGQIYYRTRDCAKESRD